MRYLARRLAAFLETSVFSRSAMVAGFFVLGFFFAPGVHAATNVSGNVSGTWNVAGSPYIVSSATVQPTQTLTIEAGTVVKFTASNAFLTVNGTLVVNGTPLSKVTLTSFHDDSVGGDSNGNGGVTVGSAGQWGGVAFNSSAAVGNISNLDIRYAGGSGTPRYTIGAFAGSNVSITGSDVSFGVGDAFNENGSTLSVVGSYVHDFLGGSGMSATAGSTSLFSNTFSNVGAAATVSPTTNFTHSSNIALQAKGGYYYMLPGTLAQNQTWNADLPYAVGSLTVPAGLTLTVGEGAIVKFESLNTFLIVNGTLVVNGSPSSKVTLTSFKDDSVGGDSNGDGVVTTGSAGQWGGVAFTASTAVGTISNLDIRYAGGGSSSPKYTIGVFAGSTVSVTGSDVSFGEGDAFNENGNTLSVVGSYIHDFLGGSGINATAGTLTLNNNTFSNVGTAATISSTANFTHSGNVAAQAKGGYYHMQTGILAQSQVWNADLPYVASAITVPAGVTLTVGAGAIVKFASSNTFLTVNGTLAVNGTPSSKVTFTSFQDDSVGGDSGGEVSPTVGSAAQWGGLLFSGSSAGNSITSAVVRYAGGGTGFPKFGIAISIPAANTVVIMDSEIYRNASNGIYAAGGTLSITGTDIHDHIGATGINVQIGTVTVSNSSFHGNGTAINRQAGTPDVDARNNWWNSVAGPRTVANPTSTGDFISGINA